MGYGMTARDSDGFVSGGRHHRYEHACWAKLKLFEESLKFVKTFNFNKFQFETDYISSVNRINKRGKDITMLGHCTNEVYKQMTNFTSSNVIWAMVNNCNLTINLDYPLDIHDLVLKDSIN